MTLILSRKLMRKELLHIKAKYEKKTPITSNYILRIIKRRIELGKNNIEDGIHSAVAI